MSSKGEGKPRIYSNLVCLSVAFFWSILALQCCVNFCYTTSWITHAHTYPSSRASLLPLQVITELTELSLPCHTAKPTSHLAYIRQCIYVNATLSIHPPSPPTRPHPMSTSVSLSLLCKLQHYLQEPDGRTQISIDRWNEEDVVHVCYGILLSHKKERNWGHYSDVDGPRGKTERETVIVY